MAATELPARFECIAHQPARYEDGSVSVSVKRALEALGQLGVAQSIDFAETEENFLAGELVATELDGRSNPMGRKIKNPGNDYRVMIPPSEYDYLGIDVDEVREGEVLLDVWICTDPDVDESVIAISPRIRQTWTLDLEPLLGGTDE
ncbi:hypothetical protein [Halopiger xanaduensis]|nr:hypothetical protein [Halopiger xanaduensis]